MAGPHKHRKDVPDYDGSYDPTDLGPQKPPESQRPAPVRREVTSMPKRQPVQPARPQPARQEKGLSASTYLVMTGVSAAVLAACTVTLGILLLRTVTQETSSLPAETLPQTEPVTEQRITEPAATEPPETEPPVTEPPETEPPETEPPETETERPRTWDALYEDLLNGDGMAWGARFDLYDADGNGTPELFVSEGDHTSAAVKIYTVEQEQVILVSEIWANGGVVTVVPEQHQIYWSSGQWPREFHVYSLDGTAFTERERMTYQIGTDQSFTINGASVSIYEFCRTYMNYVSQRCVQDIGRSFTLDEVEKLPQKAASHIPANPFFDDPWWEEYQEEPTTEHRRPSGREEDSSNPFGFFDGLIPSFD